MHHRGGGGIQALRVLYRAPFPYSSQLGAIHAASECQDAINLQTCLKQPSTVKLIKNVFYSALPLKLGNCASYEEFGTPPLLEKGPIKKKANYGNLKMADNKRRVMQTSFCVLAQLT